ncbi:hybrid sensor histidine kinase/response regulator [Desulfotignum balticum]|uniref:hybrid sensor histidine kinase/response regulator n=1 Tax=Desulfotignum balticum TaxID=115781 RepID=UPI00040D9604|nr:ATP-binding protein [Desulfotignum balticum]
MKNKISDKIPEKTDRCRILMEQSRDGIVILDQTGQVIESSQRFADMIGHPLDSMTRLKVFDWEYLFSPEQILEMINQVDEKGDHFETTHRRRDGSTYDVEITTNAAWFDGQKQIFCICRDITERKQIEAENENLQTQLIQAQKMESVGRLAGGVAHDFNNMLGIILGRLEFAMEKVHKNDSVYVDLKEIETAAKRSADITNQLLAFARKQPVSPRQLDLNDTVKYMLNLLRRLIGKDIDLIWKPGGSLWPLKMDPSQIDQILANLCVNARDAITGVGSLTIETGKQSFDEKFCSEHPGFIPGDFVRLTISDTGCGMDKNTLDNIFEPFFTTKGVGRGTGLGLSTVYGIVKQNKGFIHVHSEPGQGTSFNIYLPRFKGQNKTNMTMTGEKAASGGTETILLVEDDPAILRMTRSMLERNGYSVISAATPRQALTAMKNHAGTIDLLLTDVIMPEMNGQDLAEKITAINPVIKRLFMSGYTADIITHHTILNDSAAFIQKPFSMADLAEKLRGLLDGK